MDGSPQLSSLPMAVDIQDRDALRERLQANASGKLVTPTDVS